MKRILALVIAVALSIPLAGCSRGFDAYAHATTFMSILSKQSYAQNKEYLLRYVDDGLKNEVDELLNINVMTTYYSQELIDAYAQTEGDSVQIICVYSFSDVQTCGYKFAHFYYTNNLLIRYDIRQMEKPVGGGW